MDETALRLEVHDEPPAALAAIVDEGLDRANLAAAPLHEVRPLGCFVHAPDGRVVGGAIGRTWGPAAELQQLWVEPAWRRQGLGTRLVRAFEQRARERGARCFYLETLSFQAPALYRALGYEVRHANDAFPHGIVKFLMVREEPEPPAR